MHTLIWQGLDRGTSVWLVRNGKEKSYRVLKPARTTICSYTAHVVPTRKKAFGLLGLGKVA